MNYIQQLVARKFSDNAELTVNAKELQRLANYAMRKEREIESLEAKLALYEMLQAKQPERIRLYA